MFKNKLKKDLYDGKVCFGTFVASNAPDTVEICGLLGYDFVVIDAEHGYMSPETVIPMIRAAQVTGMTPIVRVVENSENTTLRFLDVGAYGLHIPQINSAKEAKDAVSFAKYSPLGKRGISYTRASGFGCENLIDYMKQSNEETLMIFHCENYLCMEKLDEIVATEGLDIMMFGPFDMSQSLGIAGQVNDPRIEEMALKMVEACNKHEKIAGIFCANAQAAKKRIEQGFKYIAIGVDCGVLAEAYGTIIKEAKA